MENLPTFISLLMVAVTFLTVFLFYRAARHSGPTLIILCLWLGIQAIPGVLGFYTITGSIPPRFALLLLPPLVLITVLFLVPRGKSYIDALNLKALTVLHIVRLPVELIVLGLYYYRTVPEIMTFEGSNFDILSGLSVPVVYYLVFKVKLHRNVLLIWNFCCLALLVNIVVIAILSSPFPFQQLAFDQPNTALLYFPYIWLPCCIMPLVLFSHLAAIRKILLKGSVHPQTAG